MASELQVQFEQATQLIKDKKPSAALPTLLAILNAAIPHNDAVLKAKENALLLLVTAYQHLKFV